jgi:hypothetical protein
MVHSVVHPVIYHRSINHSSKFSHSQSHVIIVGPLRRPSGLVVTKNLSGLFFLKTFLLDIESLTADYYGDMHSICYLIRALMKVSKEGLLDALSRVYC